MDVVEGVSGQNDTDIKEKKEDEKKKDCETHYRGEGLLFLTKSNKTQKQLIYLFIF